MSSPPSRCSAACCSCCSYVLLASRSRIRARRRRPDHVAARVAAFVEPFVEPHPAAAAARHGVGASRRGDHRREDGGLQWRGQPRDGHAGGRPPEGRQPADHDAGAWHRRRADAVSAVARGRQAATGDARGGCLRPRRRAGDGQGPDRDRQGLPARSFTVGRGCAHGQHVGDLRVDGHRSRPWPDALQPGSVALGLRRRRGCHDQGPHGGAPLRRPAGKVAHVELPHSRARRKRRRRGVARPLQPRPAQRSLRGHAAEDRDRHQHRAEPALARARRGRSGRAARPHPPRA